MSEGVVYLYSEYFARVLVALCFTTIPLAARGADGPPQVRWAGQPYEAAPSHAPSGSLLNPNLDYWGDSIYAEAALAFDGQPAPADGRLKEWAGGAKGGTFTAQWRRGVRR